MNRRWIFVLVPALFVVVAACSATTTASLDQVSDAPSSPVEDAITPPPVLPTAGSAAAVPEPTPEVDAPQSTATTVAEAAPPAATSTASTVEHVTSDEGADSDNVGDTVGDADVNAAPASGDIADVDFENDFAFPAPFEQTGTIIVTEGANESGSFADLDYLGFFVTGVERGDLDGDGRDEAVVATSVNGGGTGWFDALQTYQIAGDEVVHRGTTFLGDRAHGGRWHHEIVDGQVVVETFDSDLGACCPSMIQRTVYALGAAGLVPVEYVPTLRWLSLDGTTDDGSPGIPELRFLAGTSAAVLALAPYDPVMSVSLDAAPGQHLALRQVRGERPSMIELLDADDQVVARVRPSGGDETIFDATIASTGPWLLQFWFDGDGPRGDAVVLATITDSAPLPGSSWVSTLTEVVVTSEPLVALTASSPVFDAGGPVDSAVSAWLGAQTDWWLDDVIEHPPLDRGDLDVLGEFAWVHDVTLASERYVGVHWSWYEYVCCRPYPNHGNRAVVIDLVEGRLVDDGEILDLDRLDEIHQHWIEAHERTEGFVPDDTYWQGRGWQSLSVAPDGVWFGTDRSGAVHGTQTFVSWAELGELADPAFVAAVSPSHPAPGW